MSASHESFRISEQDVAQFLQQNPNFFETYPQVLAEVKLQHGSGNAVSLIERQVAVLRDQKKQLKRQLQDLVQIARDNDDLDKRLHVLTLHLIGARHLESVIDTIVSYLSRDFGAAHVALRLQAPAERPDLLRLPEFCGDADAQFQAFARLIDENKPVCGRLKAEQLSYLFGDDVRGIASAALVPLHDAPVYGLLAIGSADPQRFHAGQGTVFLTQLGELSSRALRACLVA